MFDSIKSLLEALGNASLPLESRLRHMPEVVPIAPAKPSGTVGRTLVEKTPEPYWEERGWTPIGGEYVGFYKTRFATCEGRISVSAAGYCAIYIKDPPASIRNHPKWICFHRHKGSWYKVNTVRECRDVSSAIFEIENIITESYELY